MTTSRRTNISGVHHLSLTVGNKHKVELRTMVTSFCLINRSGQQDSSTEEHECQNICDVMKCTSDAVKYGINTMKTLMVL